MRLKLLLLLSTVIVVTSCRTEMTDEQKKEYIKNAQTKHQNEKLASAKSNLKSLEEMRSAAIADAREFALENAKDLDESKHSYIRFNTPHIYQSVIIAGEGRTINIPMADDERKKRTKPLESWDRVQTLMIWYPPAEKMPVTVMGTSRHDLSWFEPVKIVRERLYIPQTSEETARKEARDFAMQNLLYLQDKPRSQNMVRFDNPVIADSQFEIDLKTTNHYKDLNRKEQYILDKQELKQTSFIWSTDDPAEKVVVTGVWYEYKQVLGKRKKKSEEETVTEDEDTFLRNWIPVKAQMYPTSEINNLLVK